MIFIRNDLGKISKKKLYFASKNTTMDPNFFKMSYYSYELPVEFIARQPTSKRDNSRLLVLHRKSSRVEHRKFSEITEFLNSGDVLVLNDTKVIPAMITSYRKTGGKVEALVIKEVKEGVWEMLLKANRRIKENESLYFENRHDVAEGFSLPHSVKGRVISRTNTGSWMIEFRNGKEFTEVLRKSGRMPLPPYIKRNSENVTLRNEDFKRYQTVYAKKTGAIAAPTAGLHFTKGLLEKIAAKGIKITYVTLHVGLGTFKPIEKENFEEHKMHKEFYIAPKGTIEAIKKAKSDGKKIIATGTTTCKVLETVAGNSEIEENTGWTNLFIYPTYKFMLTDSLITNFHLPGTSLILLVSAFAGRDNIITSYETAIKHGYRFYSYGDCMLIL